MLRAQSALQEYVERSEPGTVDIALHLRLAEELNSLLKNRCSSEPWLYI